MCSSAETKSYRFKTKWGWQIIYRFLDKLKTLLHVKSKNCYNQPTSSTQSIRDEKGDTLNEVVYPGMLFWAIAVSFSEMIPYIWWISWPTSMALMINSLIKTFLPLAWNANWWSLWTVCPLFLSFALFTEGIISNKQVLHWFNNLNRWLLLLLEMHCNPIYEPFHVYFL